ncbi:MAG: DEAD/DEAH box helicase [Gammaproteobacteria bacterium]|nr:DEAD/DEAH box helicase [Gammaproteobacteria bacterium]
MLFKDLGLSAELLRAISEQGYSEATPIQQQAIPVVLAGRDILAGAQTGTGKTAGFTLPILQRLQLAGAPGDYPRVLILTPTRELAAQVEQSVTDYGRHLPYRSLTIFGGVSINPQKDKLRRGADIVVATPGRLLDHVQQQTIDLSAVEILVLDEADRMLDMGFIRDMRRIFKVLPKKRQTLLFSATFSQEIRQLANDLLHQPAEVQATPQNTTVETVSQVVYPVDKHRKRELLSHRIGAGNWQQVLVFTRTKHGANRLAKQLDQDGIRATAIHGNKSQGARTRALAQFKAGQVRVLVATDIAARGLDIDKLPHVVNYELPNVPEDYVHRIGRTARAGQHGHAVSLVSHDEQKLLRDIERLLRTKIDQEFLAGYEPEHWSDDSFKKPAAGKQPGQRRRGPQPAVNSAAKPGGGRRRRRRRRPAASPAAH